MRQDGTYVLEDFLDVRSNPEQKKGFFIFYDTFVTCVSGKKKWTPSVKVNMTISGSGRVSISDEAFTELVLMNYWNRWVHKDKPTWTDSRIGSVEFQGWSADGHMKFNELFKRVQEQRNTIEANLKVDNLFIVQSREKYNLNKHNNDSMPNSQYENVEEICMDPFVFN